MNLENKKNIRTSQIMLFGCLALVLFIFLVYGQVSHFDFVHYDDHVYVTDNLRVRAGLTAENICWSLLSLDAGFWHPLTWLSLMLDHDLYGLNAGGYHVTNILLHIINTLLLFIVLTRMTGALWRSFFVAALFALHPLHVESVAWIAARKDVLSTFFMMLTLWSYYRYSLRPVPWRYFIVVVFFVSGLMSKSMLVTLPFILLLLDWWPLNRYNTGGINPDFGQYPPLRKMWLLFLEKTPLLVLSIGVSVATLIAEERTGALTPMISYSPDVRLANAFVSYVLYIGKTLFPVNLAVFYPHPGLWPAWAIITSFLLLAAITYFSLSRYRRCPYLAVGWLWYLGMLVPVIGLIQVGTHAMADRYTYIPLIGLFIGITWGSADVLRRLAYYKKILAGAGVVVLLLLSVQSFVQASYWRDAIELFRHALDVTKNNYIAHNNLGAAYARRGNSAEAINHYREAIKIMPHYLMAHFNMAATLTDQGELVQAAGYYRRVLNMRPDFAEAHNNLAIVLARRGELEKSIEHFRKALHLRPDYGEARNNLQIAEGELKNRSKETLSR